MDSSLSFLHVYVNCVCFSLIIRMKGQRVTCDLYDISTQVKVTEDVPHGASVRVHVMMSPWIVLIKVQNEGQKLPESTLVEHAHQI